MTISVLILTKNEEQDLPGCLDSVAWSDDIHVLDSESTDQTRDIATKNGASVTIRKFDDYAQQRNAGLKLPFQYPWLLIVDADERIPTKLADEIVRSVSLAPDSVVGFRIRRRDFLLGTWLKYSQASPFYIRLVRPGLVAYTPRLVNEVLEPCPGGEISALREPFDHYPFSKGIEHWFSKHNIYSSMEARQIALNRSERTGFSLWKALFEKDFHRRRVHQKELFYRLPFRPLLKFILLYFLKGGFLDGRAGLLYCQMQACYERMIVIKTAILAQQETQPRNGAENSTSPSPLDRKIPRK